MSRDELVSGPPEPEPAPGRRRLPPWLGWAGLIAAGFVAVQLAGTGEPMPPQPPEPSRPPQPVVTVLPGAPLNVLASADQRHGTSVKLRPVDPRGRTAELLIECIGPGVVQVTGPGGRSVSAGCDARRYNSHRFDLYRSLGVSRAAGAPAVVLHVESTVRPPEGRWRVSVQLPLTLP